MNKVIIAIAAIALLGATFMTFQKKSTPITEEIQRAFERFTYIHGKSYADEHASYRLQVFADNYAKVEQLNSQNDGVQYSMNKFSDLTAKEFKAQMLGYKAEKNRNNANETYTAPEGFKTTAIDWTTLGKVQKVKDQGQCGSCWAFSAIGSVESEDAIHGTELGNFSEQQLVDCSGSYGNYGCNGGLMDYAFKYIIKNGIATESDYPYTARDGKCKTVTSALKISKFTDVRQSDCDGLASALQSQPISVAVDAERWQFYSGGVFSNCGTSLDHGVLLVGVSDDNTWKIKNSWGTSWGENGFIRLKNGNTCGVCLAASWPGL